MKREWQSVISPILNISVYNIWQQKKQREKDFWNQGRCYTLLKLIVVHDAKCNLIIFIMIKVW